MERTKAEIDAEIAEMTAKRMKAQTADIEGIQADQAAQRRRNVFQMLGDMLVAVTKMLSHAFCRFFGIETPEDRRMREAAQAQAEQAQSAANGASRRQGRGDAPDMGLKSDLTDASALEMKAALEKVIGATLDPKKVDEPLNEALQAIGSKAGDFDQWEFRVKPTENGLFSIMSKASPSHEWKPFLEGIPTKKDAAAVVASVPRDEMDRIARAGRILEHVAAQQGQDGPKMRERFTSAAAYYVLTGKDWRTDDFAEKFPPYLQGDGPRRPIDDLPQAPPMSAEVFKAYKKLSREERQERALELPDGSRIELPPLPSPHKAVAPARKIEMEGVDLAEAVKIDAAWKGEPLSCEAAERRGNERMARRREIGDEAYELEISGAEPEPAYGPRM